MPTNVEPDQLEFRGEDLKECEQFIAAVNRRAREEGRFRDDQWIADLAGASMAGDALIWWSSLDDETQESWKLLRKAMLSRYQLHFSGKTAAEADHFVHWVRQRALDARKLDDPNWAAKLASRCSVGSALRWYTFLDPRIRGDWDALQQAIFLQYNESSEDGYSGSIVPTAAPAAAAPASSKPRTRGRIRFRRENDSGVYYLSKALSVNPNHSVLGMITTRLTRALQVEYESRVLFDDPEALFIPDNQLPGFDLLGI